MLLPVLTMLVGFQKLADSLKDESLYESTTTLFAAFRIYCDVIRRYYKADAFGLHCFLVAERVLKEIVT